MGRESRAQRAAGGVSLDGNSPNPDFARAKSDLPTRGRLTSCGITQLDRAAEPDRVEHGRRREIAVRQLPDETGLGHVQKRRRHAALGALADACVAAKLDARRVRKLVLRAIASSRDLALAPEKLVIADVAAALRDEMDGARA